MYSDTSLLLQSVGYFDVRKIAAKGFHHASRYGLWRRLWATLNGQMNALKDLNQFHPNLSSYSHHFAGIRTVAIQKISGTEGRSDDFDAEFRPLKSHNKDRWINILAAHMRGISFPPVELIQVGEEFFVRDGHHRISVAKFLGQIEIDARVIVYQN